MLGVWGLCLACAVGAFVRTTREWCSACAVRLDPFLSSDILTRMPSQSWGKRKLGFARSLCSQERYDVRRDQSEAVKVVSSFRAYIMTHSRAKARGRSNYNRSIMTYSQANAWSPATTVIL
ncbi:hypothetical protein HAX54_010909 [Datura stramonium]|uniref:Secreted protein n=1 Tax=Datura stramonium TaxID=4076 RepID=A0ABS8TIL1_DATST|nr:hypothetical protein [Datura stramonium]